MKTEEKSIRKTFLLFLGIITAIFNIFLLSNKNDMTKYSYKYLSLGARKVTDEITKGVFITQEIPYCAGDKGFSLQFTNNGHDVFGNIFIKAVGKNSGATFVDLTVPGSRIMQNEYVDILFENGIPNEDEIITISVTADSTPETGSALLTTGKDTIFGCSFAINGIEMPDDLMARRIVHIGPDILMWLVYNIALAAVLYFIYLLVLFFFYPASLKENSEKCAEDHILLNKSFRKDILKNSFYWVLVIFISILSYGFDIMNRSVNIDDLLRSDYTGSGRRLIRGMRWAATFYMHLFSDPNECLAEAEKLTAFFFLLLSSVFFSRILYIYCCKSKYRTLICTIFSCLYISYPLVNELWNCTFMYVAFVINAVIIPCCILYLYDSRKIISRKTFICSILLSFAVSSYEASAFLFVTAVLSVLLMDYIFLEKKEWIVSGLKYMFPIIGAVILRFVIGSILIRILGLSYSPNGHSGIYWAFTDNMLPQITNVLILNIRKYFFNGLIYQPIAVFVMASFLGLICILRISIKQKDFIGLLIFFLLFVSLFLLAIIQGTEMPYRTAQSLQYFSALMLTLFVFSVSQCENKTRLFYFSMLLMGFLSFRQGIFLNKTLALNNQRADNEAAVIYNLGYQLESMYDKKLVIFTGNYDLGENINRQNRVDTSKPGGWLYRKIAVHFGWNYEDQKIYETDVASHLNWAKRVYNSQRIMGEVFSYYGFDIITADKIPYEEYFNYEIIAEENNMKPLEIRDMGDYILIYFG